MEVTFTNAVNPVTLEHGWGGLNMTKRRILVVEDDAAIRRGVVDALSYAGFDALEAGHGDEGRNWRLLRLRAGLLDLVPPGTQDGNQRVTFAAGLLTFRLRGKSRIACGP